MSSYTKSRVSSHISATTATATVRPQEIPEPFEDFQKREQAAFVLSRTDHLIWHANARNEVCDGVFRGLCSCTVISVKCWRPCVPNRKTYQEWTPPLFTLRNGTLRESCDEPWKKHDHIPLFLAYASHFSHRPHALALPHVHTAHSVALFRRLLALFPCTLSHCLNAIFELNVTFSSL